MSKNLHVLHNYINKLYNSDVNSLYHYVPILD